MQPGDRFCFLTQPLSGGVLLAWLEDGWFHAQLPACPSVLVRLHTSQVLPAPQGRVQPEGLMTGAATGANGGQQDAA
jgi:hypothetical protein